jgi:hypothetical protein
LMAPSLEGAKPDCALAAPSTKMYDNSWLIGDHAMTLEP